MVRSESHCLSALGLILFVQCVCPHVSQSYNLGEDSLKTHEPKSRVIRDIIPWSGWIQSLRTQVLPVFLEDHISSRTNKVILETLGKHNEDSVLNFTQLLQKYRYPVEEHRLTTEDGYILRLFRIPAKGPVVLLMHGLLGSSDDYILLGPDKGLAYLLSNAGYDVWLGNARGNKHSRAHMQLSPDTSQFWDFSWDEIGMYDLPAIIDYVLKITSEHKLKYIGHSQGTTTFFVMCSMRPEYNEKVSLMIALSAVAWMSNAVSPVIRLLAPVGPFVGSIFKLFGVNELLPHNELIKTLTAAVCGTSSLANVLCSNIFFLFAGFDFEQLDIPSLPVILGHVPSGASVKQALHYGQGFTSRQFRRFDLGKESNLGRYGSEVPPLYPVQKIVAPVAIFHSDSDWLANIIDVQRLAHQLGNLVELYRVPFDKFNHLDYIWAKDVKELVFTKLFKLLEEYKY